MVFLSASPIVYQSNLGSVTKAANLAADLSG